MKKCIIPLILCGLPVQSSFAEELTNEQAIQTFKDNATEIAIMASMGSNCSEAIDDGYFNTARDLCLRFVPSFTEVFEKNKAALEYSHEVHEGGISAFCQQDEELLQICINNGRMIEAYQKTLRANELGAFD